MTNRDEIEHELLAHAAAMRALAGDLVADSATADDLVQETALLALRFPPARGGSLGGWLATVLRRTASRLRRSERRRAARESAAARDERLPAADEGVAHDESLRRVTDAVLGLPEPYRSVVLARYFEDCTPTAIAQRERIPVATVKSRLQRALTMLRERLDADRSGRGANWRAGLVATLGLPRRTLITGTIWMASTTKVAFAATAALLGLAFLAAYGATPRVHSGADDAAPRVAGAAAPIPAQPLPQQREEVVAGDASVLRALGMDLPFAFAVRVRCVDPEGLPVARQTVFVGVPAGTLNRWPTVTDADGHVELAWCGRLASMPIVVGVHPSGLRELVIATNATPTITLLAGGDVFPPAQRRRPTAEPRNATAVAAPCPRSVADGARVDCRACHATPIGKPSPFDTAPGMHRGHDDQLRFSEWIERSLVAEVLGFDEMLVGEKVGSDGGLSDERFGVLTGTVVDASGRAAAEQPVGYGLAVDRVEVRTMTDSEGRFRFARVPVGTYELRAGGRDLGLGRSSVAVDGGGETFAALHLDPGAAVRGRVDVSIDGKRESPVGARVTFETDDGTHADVELVESDGTFVIPNAPSTSGRVTLWMPGCSMPVAWRDGVVPDAGVVPLELGDASPFEGRLTVALRESGANGPMPVEVRVVQATTGRVAWMHHDGGGRFSMTALPAAAYRIHVGADACGWVDLGVHWVDGRATTDLGHRVLPEPARLQFVRSDASKDTMPELYLRRADVDARVWHMGMPDVAALALPAGNWFALWRDPAGDLAGRAFELRAGESTDLRVGTARD
jgi:RNA polymerase sigma-70 factor (ECF subfamily)